MSLDLPHLLPQVQKLSQSLSERHALQQSLLDKALHDYHAMSSIPADELDQRVTLAGSSWVGARLSHEPTDHHHPPPQAIEHLTVISADGSQIYPDRHAAAAFFLVNIAAIQLEHDQDTAPETFKKTDLYFEEPDLHYESGQPIGNAWVNLKRDVGEMEILADLCQRMEDRASLALLDNSLLLWMMLQVHAAGQEALDRCLKSYLDSMERIHKSGCVLAGIIDRPRSHNVLALTQLAQLPISALEAGASPPDLFDSLTDRQLFSHLLVEGNRSPCFKLVSPLNRDFQAARQGIHFFYLHTKLRQILRVEVPDWVAEDDRLLDQVHAGILRDGRTTGGYPYALIRAHELAVVTHAETRMLEDWISKAMADQGLVPEVSQKSWSKALTGSPGAWS